MPGRAAEVAGCGCPRETNAHPGAPEPQSLLSFSKHLKTIVRSARASVESARHHESTRPITEGSPDVPQGTNDVNVAIGSVAPTSLDFYAPIRRELAAAQRAFDAELDSDVRAMRVLCDRVRGYRGKMLRPALVLLSGRAVGELTDAHPTLAAVVEMVHMATLVHDDVIDQADERRTHPTVCATEGNIAAVLLGDYLISHAFHLCSGLDSQWAARRVAAATNTVCEGELLQNHHIGNDRLGEEVYLDIVGRKTGALTAVACELGATFAGATPTVADALRAYGLAAGMAFQIVDDVLDVVGERAEVGKTLGLDLVRGKLTLPTIHCLEHSESETAARLGTLVAGEAACDRSTLRRWHEATGSIDYAMTRAAGLVDDAVRFLDVLPASEAKTALSSMARFIIERKF